MTKPTIIKPNGDAAGVAPGQMECVQLLTDLLADAKQGKITTCLVVACGPMDFGSAMAGPDAARLNLGLDVAKRTILERTSPPIGGGRSVLHR